MSNDNSDPITSLVPATEWRTIHDLYDEELPLEVAAAWPWIGYVNAAMATEFLKANRKPVIGEQGTNRNLSRTTVADYTREILAGKWRWTHQGAAFNAAGALVDGQHRFEAIVAADKEQPGISILMVVWYNVPDESQEAMDRNFRRIPGQFLTMDGLPSGQRLSKVLQLVKLYDERVPGKIGHEYWRNSRFTVTDIRDLSHRFEAESKGLLSEASKVGGNLAKFFTPSAGAAAWILLLRNNDRDTVEQYFDALVSGANLSARDPRLCIRNWSTNLRNDSKRTEVHMQLVAILKAFSQWREYAAGGNGIQYFYLREDESVPVV